MNRLLFTVVAAVVLACSLVEECRGCGRPPRPPIPFPRPRPYPPPDYDNRRFLSATTDSELMYLGNADGKDFYAALNLPMDWNRASDYCAVSHMELASSEQTESQKELLSNAVNDVAYAFGIKSSESPIRFWTSSRVYRYIGSEDDNEELADTDMKLHECKAISVSGTELTTGYVKCEEEVEITICEVVSKE